MGILIFVLLLFVLVALAIISIVKMTGAAIELVITLGKILWAIASWLDRITTRAFRDARQTPDTAPAPSPAQAAQQPPSGLRLVASDGKAV